MPRSVAAAVDDFGAALIGQDARAVEKAYWTMYRIARQHLGIGELAAAGIELALWDIKARALGVSVCELKGGLMRERIRLYWSHCGTTRAGMPRRWGAQRRSYDDITALGKEVVSGLHGAQDEHRDPATWPTSTRRGSRRTAPGPTGW